MKLPITNGTLEIPDQEEAGARFIADLFYNNGVVEDEDIKVEWEDMYRLLTGKQIADAAVATSDVQPLLRSSLEILVREPVEPLATISGLFEEVRSEGLNTQVIAGAIGAVVADDIPEEGTYPEVNFQVGGGMKTAWINKSGIAASFTDEVLRYSNWDLFSRNLRLMGAALVRHRETKAASFLRNLGTTLFDNASPSTSMFGVCTGRGLDMSGNGTLTVDDLFKGMAHMADEGFHPNIILVNPFFYLMFLQDEVLRNIMLAGGGGAYFQKWTGNPGPRTPWSNGSMGKAGPTHGTKVTAAGNAAGETPTGIKGREYGMTSAFQVPAYFPWPFQVVVSPHVPFDAENMLGDIYLLSAGNVGYLLRDENPVQVQWRDESTDVVKVKIRERYGFYVVEEGLGIGVFRNVKLGRNYWDGGIKAVTHDVVSEIGPTDNVL